MSVGVLFLSIAVALQPGQAASGPAQASPELQRADALYAAADWPAAAAAYEAVTKQPPTAPAPHFKLAVSRMALGRHADAFPHLQEAAKLGAPPVAVALR